MTALLPTNSHFVKLTGKVCILEPLTLSQNFKVIVQGSVTSVTEVDNENGTIDKIYKFEPVLVEAIDHLGKTIKAKDPRRMSQKVRSLLWRFWEEDDKAPTDFEEYYNRVYKQIILELSDLIERSKN